MFSMPGASEWVIILVIVLIFFGAGKLPDVMRQFGRGIREFKDASAGEEEKVKATGSPKRTPRQLGTDELDDEDEVATDREAEPAKKRQV
jgi:TatA/E family protein of Tat protein translocase